MWSQRFGKVPEGMRTPLTGNYWCTPRQHRRGGTWAIGCTVCALVNESHTNASTTRPKEKHNRRKLREFDTKFARFEIRSIPQPSLFTQHARGPLHVRALRLLNRVVRKRKRKQLAAAEEPVTTEGTHAGAEEPGKGDGYMYELRWALTGTPIKVCIGHGDVSVEQLEQQLEEGYFEEYGVPRATDDNGDWLDWQYTLMHGTRKLSCGQFFFSDYNIPLHGATINVLKQPRPSLAAYRDLMV